MAAGLFGFVGVTAFLSARLRTRPGPKSGVRAGGFRSNGKLQILLYFLVTTSNFSGSNGVKVGPSPMGGPGAPILGAKPHGQIPTVASHAAKKRSFRRGRP